MLDILFTIFLFIVLFGVGSVLLVVAFYLYTWASKRAKREMADEKEQGK